MAKNSSGHPFGCKLPTEIYESVFEYAVEGKVTEGRFRDPSKLPLWRLVNKSWNACLSPLFFNSFTFHGSMTKMRDLWRFLHTVVTCPEKAQHVRRLTISGFAYYEFKRDHVPDFRQFTDSCKERLIRDELMHNDGTIKEDQPGGNDGRKIGPLYLQWLYEKNREWLESAMAKAGFNQDVKARAVQVLSHGRRDRAYQSPLVALIIAYCPNLRDISTPIWPSERDPWLELVLGYAIEKTTVCPLKCRPLQKLTSLSVRGQDEIERKPGEWKRPGALISNTDSIKIIPGLQELTVIGWDALKLMRKKPVEQSPNNIQHLTIYQTGGYMWPPPRISPLLRSCPNLSKLSLRLAGDSIGPRLYAYLWYSIRPLEGQLEYLDFYPDGLYEHDLETDHGINVDDTEALLELMSLDESEGNDTSSPTLKPYCPPLAGFTKLRQLCVPALMLAGYKCQHSRNTKLRSHLPPRLESLAVYNATDDYLWDQPVDLKKELAGIAEEGSYLRFITTLGDSRGEFGFDKELAEEAHKRGIVYLPHAKHHVFAAGKYTTLGDAAHAGNETDLRARYMKRNEVIRDAIPRGMTVHGYEGAL